MKIMHPYLYTGLIVFIFILILLAIIMIYYKLVNDEGDININFIENFAIKNEYPGGMNRVDKIYVLADQIDSKNMETMLKCNWIMADKIKYGINDPRNVILDAIKNNYQNIIILHPDFEFKKHPTQTHRLFDYLMTTNGIKWDLISFSNYGSQLGWSSYQFLKKIINNKDGLEFIHQNGYLINRSYFQKMIENLNNDPNNGRNYENDNWYVFLPQLG